MIQDIWTVMRKELCELRSTPILQRNGLFALALILLAFGVFFPWLEGAGWIQNPLNCLSLIWVPILIVTAAVTDSIAGERERHTLEALLASRLSERAILAGKVLTATLIGWAVTLLVVGLDIVTVNLSLHGPGLILFTPFAAVTIVIVGLLLSALSACAGVIVSLCAGSVLRAQQTIGVTALALFMAILYGRQALAALLDLRFMSILKTISDPVEPVGILMMIVSILIVADIVTFVIAAVQFQRTRLMGG